MYDLLQQTHRDWIDLDDMNNLADTKGGNINAHIYSNLFAGGAWTLCFPAASVSSMWKSGRCPQCWINPEMYLRLRIIHIRMHDNDSQMNPWRERLPAVFLCTAGNFFPSWPLARQRSLVTANTPIDADTWAGLCSSRLSPGNPSVPVRQHTGNGCPTFVLVSTTFQYK